MNWIVEKITKNHYKATSDDGHFIEFKLDEIFENYDVIIDNSHDMSSDGIIFFNKPYPTPDEDANPIIGEAYFYKGTKCTKMELVGAIVIDSDIPNPKGFLETICY